MNLETDGLSEWRSAPAVEASQSSGAVVGRLTLIVQPRAVERCGQLPVRARWVTESASDGGTTIVELIGIFDPRTGMVRLSGMLADRRMAAASRDRARPAPPLDDVRLRAPVEGAARDHDAEPRRFGLTPREAAVAQLLARGEPNARVAELLGISPHTARRHTESVMLKLDAHNRAQVGAILRGERNGPQLGDEKTHMPRRNDWEPASLGEAPQYA